MLSHDYSTLGDQAIALYIKTQDPLTLSAAKILYRADPDKPPTKPVEMAVALIKKQLRAYKTLYTENL